MDVWRHHVIIFTINLFRIMVSPLISHGCVAPPCDYLYYIDEEGTPWAMLFTDDLVLCDPDREMMELRHSCQHGPKKIRDVLFISLAFT